jgi:hypothetical protein
VTYVLVSLVGDKATQDADLFARWFAARHPPAAAYHEASPAHATVRDAVRETPAALVFAHDGGTSVRAIRGGAPWADAHEFARVFEGARVWVYACDTLSAEGEADLTLFGGQAHAEGVRVFAGHYGEVTLPSFPTLPNHMEAMYTAFRQAFVAFLDGENDVYALRGAALGGVPRRRAALNVSPYVKRAMTSLRVLA